MKTWKALEALDLATGQEYSFAISAADGPSPKQPPPNQKQVPGPVVNHPNVPPMVIKRDENGAHVITVTIKGEIRDVCLYAPLAFVLQNLEENDTIRLKICGPGGNLAAGAMLATKLHNTKAHTIGIATGNVASCDSLLWAVCKEHQLAENVYVMHHNSYGGFFGFRANNTQQEWIAAMQNAYMRHYGNYLIDRHLITVEQFGHIFGKDRDVFLFEEDIPKFGNTGE